MGLPKRKITPVDQALKIIDQLSTEDLARVRKKVEWRSLVAELDEQNKDLPPLSDEEIAVAVNRVRVEGIDFLEGKIEIRQLAKEQGITACSSFDSLLGNFWPDKENADEFLETIDSIPDKYCA